MSFLINIFLTERGLLTMVINIIIILGVRFYGCLNTKNAVSIPKADRGSL